MNIVFGADNSNRLIVSKNDLFSLWTYFFSVKTYDIAFIDLSAALGNNSSYRDSFFFDKFVRFPPGTDTAGSNIFVESHFYLNRKN